MTGAPCFKCGCARSCAHREVEPAPIGLEPPKVYAMPARVYVSGGGRYKPYRNALNSFRQ